MNYLLLSNLCWKLSSFLHNLAARTISTKYLYSSARPFNFGKWSFIWRGFKAPWQCFTQSCKWAVGTEDKTNFWDDVRVGSSTLRASIQGTLSETHAQLKASHCISDNRWNLDNPSFSLPSIITNLICCSSIPITLQIDKPISIYYKNDKFVLKIAYNDLFCFEQNSAKDLKCIWNSHTLPKIRLFMWQAW